MAASKVQAVQAVMLATLQDAATERAKRQDLTNGEPGWVSFEREAMLDEVNAYRSAAGLTPADVETVARIERSAAGHVDYADKYALRCAFLALDLEWRD